MTQRKWSILILVVVIVIGAVLRAGGIMAKRTITQDEGWSYLSATGHQGEFRLVSSHTDYPVGTWTNSSEWKRYLRIEKRMCFGQISGDQARFTGEPPLYFWLLHLWSLIVGVKLWTGPSLNVLLAGFATVLLYGLAKHTLGNSAEATAVAFLWAVSPAVIQVSLVARQYDLLALCSIAFTWILFRCIDARNEGTTRNHILLIIVCCAGLLMHYHFSIVVAGCLLIATLKLVRSRRRRLIAILGCVGVGYALFFILHPHFYRSVFLMQAHTRAQAAEYPQLIPRVERVVSALFGFFVFNNIRLYKTYIVAYALALLGLGVVVWAVIRCIRGGSQTPEHVRRANRSGLENIYLFLWVSGVTISLYLAFLSPRHAMGPKYLSTAWPFYAFIPIFVARCCGKYARRVMLFLCLGFLASAVCFIYTMHSWQDKQLNPRVLRQYSTALIDNVNLGVFPRIIWHVREGTSVFAANQDYLLEHEDTWLDGLGERAVYISHLAHVNKQTGRQRILDLLARTYKVSPGRYVRSFPIHSGVSPVAKVFELEMADPSAEKK